MCFLVIKATLLTEISFLHERGHLQSVFFNKIYKPKLNKSTKKVKQTKQTEKSHNNLN